MPLTSDLVLNASKFDPENISEQTNKFNNGLIKIMEDGPLWWEVSPLLPPDVSMIREWITLDTFLGFSRNPEPPSPNRN
jgi:hypothetical protein